MFALASADSPEHCGNRPRPVLDRGHHDPALRLDLKTRIDERPARLLGILDQDVIHALVLTHVATRPFDVDACPPQRIARAQQRAGPVDEPHGQIGSHHSPPGRCGAAPMVSPRVRRRTARACSTTSSPATRARPASGASSVARMCTTVVLPAPFGPRTPGIVPSSTARSSPSRAQVGPYDFSGLSTRITGLADSDRGPHAFGPDSGSAPKGIRTPDLHLERVASWASRRWGPDAGRV